MKKLLLLFLFVGFGVCTMQAQKSLIIQKPDGSKVEQAITNQTTIQFQNESMVVMENSVQLLAISLDEISRLNFSSSTDIKFVNPGDATALKLVQNGQTLHIKGLQQKTHVALYQMSGKLCMNSEVAPAGTLSVSQLPAGIYFLRVDNVVFKFLKK